jgi:glucose/arabinose dehydrogenase
MVGMVTVLLGGTLFLTLFKFDSVAEPSPTSSSVVEAAGVAAEEVEETPATLEDGSIDTAPLTVATNALGERIVVLPDDPLQGLTIEVLATDLFQPTIVVNAPGTTNLYVTERVGRIKLIDENGVQETSWVNLTDKVQANGIEQGLLGLAFHPDFATNGRFFVYYTNKDSKRTLSEFSGNATEGFGSTEKVLFLLSQPADSTDPLRHWGGMLQFGPDGLLYVSLGDGADARGQGQNPNTFFAAVLRLDVDNGDPYAIPADNPFVGGGGAPEVFAFGLRNPWRFWIDPYDNEMYIADVGQGNWEEIDVISLSGGGGYNLGWGNMEGTHCFFESGCDINDYTAPVLEYDHSDGQCSVTGGPVYRGAAIPELDGHYFYADWCAGWVRSFRYVDGVVTNEQDWTNDLGEVAQINGMGIDSNGEIIIATYGGQLLRIVPIR